MATTKTRGPRQRVRFANRIYQASCPQCTTGAVELSYDIDYQGNVLRCVNCAWQLIGKELRR